MKRKSGQSFSEYSIFVAVILLAIIFMNVYVKRGLQGRYADIADVPSNRIRPQAALATPYRGAIDVFDQYEPPYISSNATVEAPTGLTQQITAGTIRKDLLTDTTTIEANEKESADVD